jgi:hypothetical protein
MDAHAEFPATRSHGQHDQLAVPRRNRFGHRHRTRLPHLVLEARGAPLAGQRTVVRELLDHEVTAAPEPLGAPDHGLERHRADVEVLLDRAGEVSYPQRRSPLDSMP